MPVEFELFKQIAATRSGGPLPSEDCYDKYKKALVKAGIRLSDESKDRNEELVFLTHCVWETTGLKHLRELNQGEGQEYGTTYYGRGMMMLTWKYNYSAASEWLFEDKNVLLDDPDKVARDLDVAWNTAAWFWRVNVKPSARNSDDPHQMWKDSLRKINGGSEPPGSDGYKAREKHYNKVHTIFWE